MSIGRSSGKVVTLTALAVGMSAAMESVNAAQVIEEVVVTATKRETLLQKTSESLQVLTDDVMTNRGIVDFESYFLSVPSLSQSDSRGPGNRRYAIRGVQSAGEPLVGVYLDDIPLLGSPGESLDPGGSQPDLKLWDIERVEILKGPQGTLYGNGSGGGSIRVITKKPDASEFDAGVRLSVADIDHGGLNKSLSGMLNLPVITDELAIRLSAYTYDNEGYIDEVYLDKDDANTEETEGGRLAVRWTPNDNATITLSGIYQTTETGAEFEIFKPFSGGDNPSAAQLTDTGFDDEITIANLTFEYSFEKMDLFYSGSWQEREVERRGDQTRFVIYGIAGVPAAACPETALDDGSCINFINAGPFGTVAPLISFGAETGESTSHEVRLTSSFEGAWQWMLGLYYEDRTNEREGHVTTTNAAGQFDGNGNTLFARDNVGDREQKAVFGEVSYEFAPGWTFTTGLRWFEVERDEKQQTVINNFGPTGVLVPSHFKEDDIVSRFKISWDMSEDVFLYALAAEGFRVGGPNQPVGFNNSAPDFDADSLWNYEFGWKTSLLDGAMNLNGAVYYVDWSEVQFATSDPTGAFSLIGNAGDAEVLGFELELQALLAEHWEVSAGIGYSDAEFTGNQPVQGLLLNQTRDGDRLVGVPEWSTTLFVQYTNALNDSMDLVINGDWAYRSDTTTGIRPEAGNFRVLDSYHQVNLRAGVEMENWKVMLEVANLFNEQAEVAGRIVDFEPFQFATIPPRTVGLTVSYQLK